jgi:hypothetical protein
MARAPGRYRTRCVCDWPRPRRLDDLVEHCDGSGTLDCEGCAGDGVCVCVCGGRKPCPGCAACREAVA